MVEAANKGVVAAIGNFDGVHRGHQRLLAETLAFAKSLNHLAGAVAFEPHPRLYFKPDDPPFLLTTSSQREALLYRYGAERVLTLAFNAALAALTPEQFVLDVLKKRLGVAGVVTGTDFRFGKGRSGDAAGLKRLCEEAGLAALLVTPKPEADGEKIGSSAIRTALQEGDVRAAAGMLGRPWAIEGAVLPGAKLGRTLGFPTANMTLGDLVEPRRGVYAVKALLDGCDHNGVANFGRRPTVGSAAPLLETHLFDFAGDLYGKTLEVRLIEFLRDEKKFDGLDALKAQISIDSERARKILAA